MTLKWVTFMENSLEHKFIQTNSIKMHYVTTGKGPLLLLLHGFPQFWYTWRHQIPVLAKHFTVVAPDLRGYNDSDKPPNVDDYKPKELVEDIVGLIHGLGHDKAFLVGHDWGGAVAWRVAIAHPEVLEKLVIINAPHPLKMAKALQSDFSQIRKSWYFFFFQLPKLPEYFVLKNLNNIDNNLFTKTAFKRNAFTQEDLEQYSKAISKPGAITAVLNYYRAIFKHRSIDKKNDDYKILTPTLLIWGEQDKALGKELTYNMETLFNAPFRIEYISDAGHWVPEEQPEIVNRLLLEFLTT